MGHDPPRVFRSAGVQYAAGMRATRQVRYSVSGIFDLAYHGAGRPIRVEEIGERQGVPIRYLEQLFQRLRRAGLVTSKRGPGGGYVLARPPEQISLADVVRAVQGEVLLGPAGPGHESLGFIWEELRAAITEALASRTVASLCREAARRGLDRVPNEPLMYHI
jgi:Rrf2 family transcriptional regulator, iron-sulfur cluster assembly transcription factor